MSYPQITDYQDAVQDPRTFYDPSLKTGKVATTPLGLPLALSGGFALTYLFQVGQKRLAVRCFHKEVPNAQARYAQVSSKLSALGSKYFVHFDFQAQGIRIGKQAYPIVKMDWVEGDTLGVYLERNHSNAINLNALRHNFAMLAEYLERNSIAHGDIQNENIIVEQSALRLIDYDGMFVPGLPEGRGTEIGHKHFQHPHRTTKLFGPKMDRFSFIVIDVSLQALQIDPCLHKRFREGGNAIIFNANDFSAPTSSEIFRILKAMPALRDSATNLAAVCEGPISAIPTLADFRDGKNIPAVKAPPSVGAPQKATPRPVYIGAFDVIDAKDFNAVLRRVGDKVELVGKIVSVKEGVGKRGRGRGLPYVFINFGPWNQESVKITIWSEGLGNLSTRPTQAWAGKWVSVTGLIDPPYEGKHYGKAYRNVGIAVDSDSQIVPISEADAKFRLGRGGAETAKTDRATQSTKPNNADVLKDIMGGASRPPPSSIPAPPITKTASPQTRNQQILGGLRGPTASPQILSPASPSAPPHYAHPSSLHYSRPRSVPSLSLLSRVPTFVWVWLGLIVLVALLRRH